MATAASRPSPRSPAWSRTSSPCRTSICSTHRAAAGRQGQRRVPRHRHPAEMRAAAGDRRLCDAAGDVRTPPGGGVDGRRHDLCGRDVPRRARRRLRRLLAVRRSAGTPGAIDGGRAPERAQDRQPPTREHRAGARAAEHIPLLDRCCSRRAMSSMPLQQLLVEAGLKITVGAFVLRCSWSAALAGRGVLDARRHVLRVAGRRPAGRGAAAPLRALQAHEAAADVRGAVPRSDRSDLRARCAPATR